MKKSILKKPKTIKKTKGIPLAVFAVTGGICVLERLDKKTGSSLSLSWSTDGLNFVSDLPTQTGSKKVDINISSTKKEKIKNCENFSISATSDGFIMTYIRKSKVKSKNVIVIAKYQRGIQIIQLSFMTNN
ncbi:MAG: hypothetical protein NTX96_01155 [Candidatus Zambryskibacteria bacterium]|nr:hypothetical protein [Candidatus Zambryskibacteria bacterium]